MLKLGKKSRRKESRNGSSSRPADSGYAGSSNLSPSVSYTESLPYRPPPSQNSSVGSASSPANFWDAHHTSQPQLPRQSVTSSPGSPAQTAPPSYLQLLDEFGIPGDINQSPTYFDRVQTSTSTPGHSPAPNSPYSSDASPSYPPPPYPPPTPTGLPSRYPKRRSPGGVSLVAGSLIKAGKSVVPGVWNTVSPHLVGPGDGLYNVLASRLDNAITRMDGESFSGGERELMVERPVDFKGPIPDDHGLPGDPIVETTNYFAKVWEYRNSRLPPHIPPCKFYLPTYPLLCLAAQYSHSVYAKPVKEEKEDHIDASFMQGTKPMVLKSLPLDDMNTIVFAIRGTQSFMDWAVNFRSSPTAPKGFLDDESNLCHAGFLGVAKSMIPQVTARLKVLLQEDPSRSHASLMITGHSAGGAVAQLLFAHMMNDVIISELTELTHFFKRVHCITFGAPPVSTIPLQKSPHKRHQKSMFYAFANEGDPVVRADTAILRSVLWLLASPSPDNPCPFDSPLVCPIVGTVFPALRAGTKAIKNPGSVSSSTTAVRYNPNGPDWKVPRTTLQLGGRIVLLRQTMWAKKPDDIEACQVTNDQLQNVVFGDPLYHTMELYARRVQVLATRAVTAGGIAA